jgi:hypothetical protein
MCTRRDRHVGASALHQLRPTQESRDAVRPCGALIPQSRTANRVPQSSVEPSRTSDTVRGDPGQSAAQLLTAVDGGPFAGSGLKPLFPPETHGVTPLADAARRTVSLVAASGAPLAAGDTGLAATE